MNHPPEAHNTPEMDAAEATKHSSRCSFECLSKTNVRSSPFMRRSRAVCEHSLAGPEQTAGGDHGSELPVVASDIPSSDSTRLT